MVDGWIVNGWYLDDDWMVGGWMGGWVMDGRRAGRAGWDKWMEGG